MGGRFPSHASPTGMVRGDFQPAARTPVTDGRLPALTHPSVGLGRCSERNGVAFSGSSFRMVGIRLAHSTGSPRW